MVKSVKVRQRIFWGLILDLFERFAVTTAMSQGERASIREGLFKPAAIALGIDADGDGVDASIDLDDNDASVGARLTIIESKIESLLLLKKDHAGEVSEKVEATADYGVPKTV